MEQLDLVKVHFDPNSLFYLNILLGFLMFGVALDIKIEDFKNILKNPKAIGLGLFCQYVLFPAITLGLIYLFHPPTSVALGMILVAACPSGNMANYMTHRAKANVTLSVSLNAIIVILAFISTPLVYGIWSDFIPEKNNLTQSISIPIIEMMKIISLLIIVPLVLGIFINTNFPIFTSKIKKGVSVLSLLIFFGFIVGALIVNWDNVRDHLYKIFFIVLIHNALGLLMGYYTGKIFSLSEKDCQTLSIESSLHNTALGLILIFKFFDGIGGMAMIAAWYGTWDLIVPFFLTNYWRHKNEKK